MMTMHVIRMLMMSVMRRLIAVLTLLMVLLALLRPYHLPISLILPRIGISLNLVIRGAFPKASILLNRILEHLVLVPNSAGTF